MTLLTNKLDSLSRLEKTLAVRKEILLTKALTSENPSDIIKANSVINNIQSKEEIERKSFLIDPLDFVNNLGYKDKSVQLSYGVLKRMAKVPIINTIIKTRINQIASFTEPQKDKYNTGFVIRKKRSPFDTSDPNKIDKIDQKKIELLTEFVLNCGRSQNWANDDFDTFVRKIVKDSLIYDQMTFEVVRDRRGIPYEFMATDASTFRIAESYDDETYHGKKKQIKGYYPSFVQINEGVVAADFYPWELCFGIRNPSTDIVNTGYGTSELEDLIHTITALLYSDEYNRKLFSQGSMPKGILKVKDVSPQKLQEFKQGWQSMMAGVGNSHKMPIIDADKIDFVNMQQNNRDMEYGRWQEYLIKIACGVYCISPDEVNFGSGSGEQKAMFEGNNEAKLKHSQDKGLYPLLKFVQHRINKYVVSQIDPNFELVFVGLDSTSAKEEAELNTSRVGSYMTLNEVRASSGLKPVEHGDIVLNSMYTQAISQAKQEEMMAKQQEQGGQGGDPNGMDEEEEFPDEEGEEQSTEKNPFE